MLDVGSLITDLGRLQDGGYLSDAMLRHAVKTIERADPRFDWVGVYLLDPEKNELWLHNYVGSPTEHARIPVGTGVCGRAVAEGTNLRIDDVNQEENYLACSASVESELVVRSGHSTQSNPHTVEEVRRILLLHAEEPSCRARFEAVTAVDGGVEVDFEM